MRAAVVRSRAWCFTINNPSDGDLEQVKELIETQCDIGLAELEHVDIEDGTPHIQGYLRFPNARNREAVSRLLPRAHLEKANGTWKDNWIYCSKEGKVFVEKGHSLEEAEKGQKIPFDVMYQDMKKMAPVEFEEKYPKEWYMRRDKVMSIMIDHAMENACTWGGNLHEKNYWIWGKPGIGKTRWATNQAPILRQLKKNFNKWWDGYNLLNTQFVILDDYPSLPQGNALAQHLKIWGDRYPFTAECKGSHLLVEPGRFYFIITSNYPIEECFAQEEDQIAISRRFKQIEMTEANKTTLSMTRVPEGILHA